MMNIGSSLRIEEQTSQKTIADFSGMSIQPFFRSKSFYKLNHENLKNWLKQADITILSLHYPSIQDNFLENLKMLSDTYKQQLFTVHPIKDSPDEFLSYLSGIEKEIESLGIKLALENMPFGWAHNPSEVYKIAKKFSFTCVTYDATHLPKQVQTIDGLEKNLDLVSIIHLSNVRYRLIKKDHLPINEGERNLGNFLEYLKTNSFQGQVILEYRNPNPEILRRDIRKIQDTIAV